jgi:hypothetical protein
MMKIVRIVIILQTSSDHNVSKNLQMPRGSSYSADKCSKNDVAAVLVYSVYLTSQIGHNDMFLYMETSKSKLNQPYK